MYMMQLQRVQAIYKDKDFRVLFDKAGVMIMVNVDLLSIAEYVEGSVTLWSFKAMFEYHAKIMKLGEWYGI